MTSKRFKVSIIYFVVVLLTLIFRIASALDIYSALGIQNDDAFWTCIVQIVIFGAVPFVSYMVFVASKEDRLLPYFPVKTKKNSEQNENENKIIEQASFAVESEYAREEAEPNISQNSVLDAAEKVDEQESSISAEQESIVFPEQESIAPAEQEKEIITAENTQENASPSSKNGKARQAFSAFIRDFGFKKVSLKNALLTVVFAVCMIIIGTAVSMLWQMILSVIGYTASSSHTHYENVGDLFLQILLVAVLPGFFEEFSHRGLLFAGYKENGWKFVILSALFFSLMHQNIRQTGYTFVDGLAMALAMYYTGSIWPGIFMHFLNNFWSVFLGYVSDVGGAFSFLITVENWLYSSIGGLIVMVLAVLLAIILATLVALSLRKDAVKRGRIPDTPFAKTTAYPISYDMMFWLTVAVGAVATVFSLVWGLIR
ncbi:MAG: CPBP family intramembrane metalloprotease [Clostridia bacterium]|nr:CPBP family intramembrane metalloprotease [Clostridia bacterium]